MESIGWYHTRLRTFDRRPLYIPNAVFATNPIENPGQMYNRRIKTSLSLRYEDITRVQAVTEQIRAMLQSPEIDQNQTILVNFNEWDSSSVNVMIYRFTRTTVEGVAGCAAAGVPRYRRDRKGAGADFAFPATTFTQHPSCRKTTPFASSTWPDQLRSAKRLRPARLGFRLGQGRGTQPPQLLGPYRRSWGCRAALQLQRSPSPPWRGLSTGGL